MKIKYSLLTLTLSSLLAVTGGCSKSAPEAAAPAAAPTETPAAGDQPAAAAAPAANVPVPKNEEAQKLIENIKSLVAEHKTQEAMALLAQVAAMPVSLEQQNELGLLRTQLRHGVPRQ
jgi:hypothetical protein